MGKKKKGFNLEFAFLADNIDGSFDCPFDNLDGYLTFYDLLDYQEAFLTQNRIYSEVAMTYMASTIDMREINEDFRISYEDIEEKYGGEFVVSLQPQIFYLQRRLDFIGEKLNRIINILNDMKALAADGRGSGMTNMRMSV
jgi:hypothetical protein